MTLIDLLY